MMHGQTKIKFTLKIITCYIFSFLRKLLEDRTSYSWSMKQVFPCKREFPRLLVDLCQVLLRHMISRLKDTHKRRLTFHVNEIDADHKEINTDERMKMTSLISVMH